MPFGATTDASLQVIIAAWPDLPNATKEAILAMVGEATDSQEGD